MLTIRSQNKCLIGEFDCLYISENSDPIRIVGMRSNDDFEYTLGKYESLDRCKEVIELIGIKADEIMISGVFDMPED
jgi:hypothetical protein